MPHPDFYSGYPIDPDETEPVLAGLLLDSSVGPDESGLELWGSGT